ncbi:uncharacterized protein CIMG_01616 [Coccidioides immitis RS]|uniref:Uncharacterized protein n=1 Tax=Coccidioides immitis (strain RS) TaxID=246410 RepID=J3KJK4_COCIM|nr:uncharacterized protein CIMG_01616 [Coccidioides immitis RS]EAS36262.3 hypothetical protein CIMG_01616 [Coccidioides immitis RS]TPX25603.1 hypothetical protein DIZ76_011058 [Coccidioides immitis]
MDRDGDSEMVSSSSPSSTTSNNQPTIPQTPRNTHSAAATYAPASLSPPASQSKLPPIAGMSSTEDVLATPSAGASGAASTQAPGMSSSTMSAAAATGPTTTATTTSTTSTPAEEELIRNGPPGALWNTQQAQEDYRREWENVLDKDFNLDAFGDPFDERDMEMKS